MRFEISERIRTQRSSQEIFAALQDQFTKVSRKVELADQSFKASAIEASFGSVNRKDETIVYVKPIDGGHLLVADVWYRPSTAFWIISLISLFSWVGWLIPIIFYLVQKKTVTQAIRACFERIKNEFEQVSTSPVPSPQPLHQPSRISFADSLEQLAQLKARGLLTEDEFALKKHALLAQDEEHLAPQAMQPPPPDAKVSEITRSTGIGHRSAVALGHDMPAGIKGWSWGGFFLSFIWAIPNKTWIGLLALVPVIGLPIPFVLGFKGREWAWRNRQWESVDHFNRVQRQWAVWGAIFYVVVLALILMGMLYPLVESRLNPPDEQEHLSSEQLKYMQGPIKIGQAAVDLAAQSASQVQTAPSVPENKTASNPIYDKHIDDQFTASTLAGTVGLMEDANKDHYITLSGVPVFKGDDAKYQFPIKLFTLPDGEQALLVESSGGRGTSCESLLFFLIINKSGALKWTPEFGTCARDGTYTQTGAQIELTIPKVGGVAHYVFANDQITEDGKVVSFEEGRGNDPAN